MAFRSAVRAEYDVALYIPDHPGPSRRMHGHSYVVEAVLEAEELDTFGFVVDFEAVQPSLAAIAAELDHRVLNELEAFEGVVPSAERQAEYFYHRLRGALEEQDVRARLVKIRVIQEPGAWAEYEA